MHAHALPPEPPLAEARRISNARRRQPTPRQWQYLDFIRRYIAEHGYPPTVREIGRALGVRSTNAVHDALKSLELKGWIKRGLVTPRSITLLSPHGKRASDDEDHVGQPRDEVEKLRSLLMLALDAFHSMPDLTPRAAQVAAEIRSGLWGDR